MSQINESAISTPGVYINEIPSFPPAVAQVATAIPAFITSGADGNLYFTEPTGKIARFTPVGVMTEVKLAD